MPTEERPSKLVPLGVNATTAVAKEALAKEPIAPLRQRTRKHLATATTLRRPRLIKLKPSAIRSTPPRTLARPMALLL
jgi:hypothetical protein